MKFSYLLVAMFALLPLLGCNQEPAPVEEDPTTPAASGEAKGGHDHSHDVGPHGGHIVDLQPAGVHAEWTHDDESHAVQVFLDSVAENEYTGVKFVAKIGEETEEFVLESEGEAWKISSEALMTHINMGEAVEVTLQVTGESGDISAKIEAHEHHHH